MQYRYCCSKRCGFLSITGTSHLMVYYIPQFTMLIGRGWKHITRSSWESFIRPRLPLQDSVGPLNYPSQAGTLSLASPVSPSQAGSLSLSTSTRVLPKTSLSFTIKRNHTKMVAQISRDLVRPIRTQGSSKMVLETL